MNSGWIKTAQNTDFISRRVHCFPTFNTNMVRQVILKTQEKVPDPKETVHQTHTQHACNPQWMYITERDPINTLPHHWTVSCNLLPSLSAAQIQFTIIMRALLARSFRILRDRAWIVWIFLDSKKWCPQSFEMPPLFHWWENAELVFIQKPVYQSPTTPTHPFSAADSDLGFSNLRHPSSLSFPQKYRCLREPCHLPISYTGKETKYI